MTETGYPVHNLYYLCYASKAEPPAIYLEIVGIFCNFDCELVVIRHNEVWFGFQDLGDFLITPVSLVVSTTPCFFHIEVVQNMATTFF